MSTDSQKKRKAESAADGHESVGIVNELHVERARSAALERENTALKRRIGALEALLAKSESGGGEGGEPKCVFPAELWPTILSYVPTGSLIDKCSLLSREFINSYLPQMDSSKRRVKLILCNDDGDEPHFLYLRRFQGVGNVVLVAQNTTLGMSIKKEVLQRVLKCLKGVRSLSLNIVDSQVFEMPIKEWNECTSSMASGLQELALGLSPFTTLESIYRFVLRFPNLLRLRISVPEAADVPGLNPALSRNVRMLKALSNLCELGIYNLADSNGDELYVSSFLQGLTHLKSLKKIAGSMLMFWSEEYSIALAEAFQKLPQLESAQIVYSRTAFWHALANSGGSKSLKHLHCYHSEADLGQIESMVQGIIRGFPRLEEFDLDLINNEHGVNVSFDSVLSLLQELKEHETLSKINVYVDGFRERDYDAHVSDDLIEQLRQVIGERIKVAVKPEGSPVGEFELF